MESTLGLPLAPTADGFGDAINGQVTQEACNVTMLDTGICTHLQEFIITWLCLELSAICNSGLEFSGRHGFMEMSHAVVVTVPNDKSRYGKGVSGEKILDSLIGNLYMCQDARGVWLSALGVKVDG